jgi:membrane fusion protein, multidrug efflux system
MDRGVDRLTFDDGAAESGAPSWDDADQGAPSYAGEAARPTPAIRVEAPAAPARVAPAPVPPAVRHDPPGQDAPRSGEVIPPRKSRKPLVLGAMAMAALAAGGYFGMHWWTVGRFQVSTDDAYVRADMTLLAAKVSGYVTSVEVANNQRVRAGDVIARIDDGDYALAVQSARDKIVTQEATIARLDEQAKAGLASVDQAKAQLAASQADLTRASLELDRQNELVKGDFSSRQKLENARADRDRAAAAVKGAEAGIGLAQANVAVFEAQKVEAQRLAGEYRTALAKAERDLSFTEVRAPVDGVVGNKAVEVGQLVQPGARLAAIVPLDQVYVDANYKETQLQHLRPGQAVDVSVDAYPGHVFSGTVESVSPASGSVFSLLPPDNATGNFTKIVQRVPVRIRLSREAAQEGLLRPGMSVVSSVNTRDAATKTAANAPAEPASATR